MRVGPELRRPDEGLATQLLELRPRYKSIIFKVGLALLLELLLCGTDAVETRGLSDGPVDGVAVAWRRADAIDATSSSEIERNSH